MHLMDVVTFSYVPIINTVLLPNCCYYLSITIEDTTMIENLRRIQETLITAEDASLSEACIYSKLIEIFILIGRSCFH